jgi:hypothetical protein
VDAVKLAGLLRLAKASLRLRWTGQKRGWCLQIYQKRHPRLMLWGHNPDALFKVALKHLEDYAKESDGKA